jgi:hypothetical protein
VAWGHPYSSQRVLYTSALEREKALVYRHICVRPGSRDNMRDNKAGKRPPYPARIAKRKSGQKSWPWCAQVRPTPQMALGFTYGPGAPLVRALWIGQWL